MPRPIRVLWLIKGLGPGGAETLLGSVARVRDRREFTYHAAYLLPWKDTLVGRLEGEGVVVHCLAAKGNADLRWLARLRRLLVSERFDVLHVHSPYPAGFARLVVTSLPQRLRPAVVSTEHNVWWGHSWPTRTINALTYPLDDAQLVVSEEVRTSIPAVLRRRAETVVHGLLTEQVQERLGDRERIRQELGADDDCVLVCTVANFRAQKGYPYLLQAARQVVDSGMPVRFVAVGQGPLEPELRRVHAELGLGSAFAFLGYREDALSVAAASDIFALASLHEGYPIAVMEALAVGLPVVATPVGGIPDAVRDGVEGLIVPPREPALLAEAILRLVRDPGLRAAMSKAATERGRAFDIRHAARRIEAVYRAVTQERQAGLSPVQR
ncbi:MAG: glycosyltransferase [Actinomycetota bacterium]|nr:glycosyltransferase [Actinomycetota bacterium]